MQTVKEGSPPARPKPPPEPPAATEQEPPIDDYEELEAEEVIAILGSMERTELEALRELEAQARARESVLHAIDSVLARAPA